MSEPKEIFDIDETGGARIGFGHVTWPFAKLSVNRNELHINASIVGNLYFKPSDIISIESSTSFSGTGVKINHRVAGYSRKVIFLTSGSQSLVNQIRDTGFLHNADPIPTEIEREIQRYQSSGSFPMKWPVAFGYIIIWNLFLLVDKLGFWGQSVGLIPSEKGVKLALAFSFFVCVGYSSFSVF